MIYELDRGLNKFLHKTFEFDYSPTSDKGVTLGDAIADIIIIGILLLGVAVFLSIVYFIYYNLMLGNTLDLISIVGIMSISSLVVDVCQVNKDKVIAKRK